MAGFRGRAPTQLALQLVPYPAVTVFIEFGDGVVIVAGARTDGDAHLLDIPAYRTARGSNVGPGEWRVARSPRGGWRAHPRR